VAINLINLKNKTKTKYLTKGIWAIFIIFITYFGNIAYMLLESEKNDDSD